MPSRINKAINLCRRTANADKWKAYRSRLTIKNWAGDADAAYSVHCTDVSHATINADRPLQQLIHEFVTGLRPELARTTAPDPGAGLASGELRRASWIIYRHGWRLSATRTAAIKCLTDSRRHGRFIDVPLSTATKAPLRPTPDHQNLRPLSVHDSR